MESVSPILTEELVGKEIIYARDQPQYRPLAVIRGGLPQGKVLSRWTFSPEERKAIARGADIYITMLTFNQPLQPILLEVVGTPRTVEEVAKWIDPYYKVLLQEIADKRKAEESRDDLLPEATRQTP